jgi:hypothetical protein
MNTVIKNGTIVTADRTRGGFDATHAVVVAG